jgi:hypothetical protein
LTTAVVVVGQQKRQPSTTIKSDIALNESEILIIPRALLISRDLFHEMSTYKDNEFPQHF